MKEKIFFSIDPVLFTLDENNDLKVLLIEQTQEPFANMMRLPGGVIDLEEHSSIDQAAYDILSSKTSLQASYFEQLKTYGNNSRDPRGWTVSTSYIGITDNYDSTMGWVSVKDIGSMDLAFDHKQIIIDAVDRLKNKVNYSLIPAHFLGQEFTMSELKKVYEAILEEKIDKSSFIKKMRETNAIEPIEGKFVTGDFRPAQVWRIKQMHHFNRNLKNKI